MHVSVYLGIESIAAFLDIRIHGRFSLGGAGPRTGRSGQHMPLSELARCRRIFARFPHSLRRRPRPNRCFIPSPFAASVAGERGLTATAFWWWQRRRRPPHRVCFRQLLPHLGGAFAGCIEELVRPWERPFWCPWAWLARRQRWLSACVLGRVPRFDGAGFRRH
jgi:hypothetical protein